MAIKPVVLRRREARRAGTDYDTRVRKHDLIPIRLYRLTMRRITIWMMLLGIVYQFGACPCGCLEHNAWLQMLGLSSHGLLEVTSGELDSSGLPGESHSLDGVADRATGSDHHDCNGGPRPLYVNDAERPPRVVAVPSVDFGAAGGLPRHALVAVVLASESERGPPGHLMLRARLATLQVFLL